MVFVQGSLSRFEVLSSSAPHVRRLSFCNPLAVITHSKTSNTMYADPLAYMSPMLTTGRSDANPNFRARASSSYLPEADA